MRYLTLVLAGICLVVSPCFATPLNEAQTIDTWQQIAQNTVLAGSGIDVSANYQQVLVIDAILDTGTATTNGLKLRVQGATTTSGNNNWYDIADFNVLAGLTAKTGQLTSGTDAGSSTLAIDSVAPLVKGTKLFIKDATITNSELKIMSNITATTTVTIESTLALGHALNTPCWAGTGTGGQLIVGSYPVNIPDSCLRIRTIYDNAQDATGSSVVIRSNLHKKTGL